MTTDTEALRVKQWRVMSFRRQLWDEVPSLKPNIDNIMLTVIVRDGGKVILQKECEFINHGIRTGKGKTAWAYYSDTTKNLDVHLERLRLVSAEKRDFSIADADGNHSVRHDAIISFIDRTRTPNTYHTFFVAGFDGTSVGFGAGVSMKIDDNTSICIVSKA